MSIEGKHAYRFGFLKSEEWKTVRIARLAKDKGKCVICGKEDLSNDCHHISYPDRWSFTTIEHIRTLCRRCHKEVHRLMEEKPHLRFGQIKDRINPPGMPMKKLGWERAAFWGRKKIVDETMIVS
jgi:hypothetical protein